MKRRMWIAIGALVAVLGAIAGLNTWVYGDFKAAPLPPMDPIPSIGSLSAAACSACHAEIYAEWKRSGHARAFLDPLYQAEVRHAPAPFVCHRCHTPLVEQRRQLAYWMWAVLPELVPAMQDNPRYDPELQREGVTCVACHQVDGVMHGPFDDPAGAPHSAMKADLRAVESCAVCHQFGFDRIGKLHRPIIDTVTEWNAYTEAGGDQRCADCHMPVLEPRSAGQVGPEPGPLRPGTDHSLRGPFDAAFVATGVLVEDVELTADGTGARAALTLVNATGHRVPTAEPQRALEVRLAATDASGAVLSETIRRFERPVNVVKLRELGPDTTLMPRERRAVNLTLDSLPAAATTLRLTVDFWLWDPDSDAARLAGFSAAELVHRLAERSQSIGGGA